MTANQNLAELIPKASRLRTALHRAEVRVRELAFLLDVAEGLQEAQRAEGETRTPRRCGSPPESQGGEISTAHRTGGAKEESNHVNN